MNTIAANSRTVLIVDDDPDVRDLAAAVLSSAGYRVVKAAGADTALMALVERPDIQLLLTDVAMPTMEGTELALAAKRTRPAIQVLFMSGHAPTRLATHPAFRDEPFLQKPWRADQLRSAVRSLIGPSIQ